MHMVKRVTKFKQLEKYYFSLAEIDALRNIRDMRNGYFGRDKPGRIKTNFNFANLYDWMKDGRTRSTKSISIKTKRIELKQIVYLNSMKRSFQRQKQELCEEIVYYKSQIPGKYNHEKY